MERREIEDDFSLKKTVEECPLPLLGVLKKRDSERGSLSTLSGIRFRSHIFLGLEVLVIDLTDDRERPIGN